MVARPPSSSPTVCAVVRDGVPALDAAVAGQERAPDTVLRAVDVLAAGRSAARTSGPAWLWLLDGTALPRPSALAALIDALDAVPPLPRPVLLTSKVLEGDGTLAESAAPWPRRDGTEVALLAVARHLLPVRAARAGSLLVAVEAVAAAAPPRTTALGTGAALEWTARLLRRGVGLLVPASVADAAPLAAGARLGALSPDPEEDVRGWVAMTRGDGWSAKEKLWLAAEGLERAGGALAAGRARPGRLLAAAAAGLQTRPR